jgi:putative colanic acid biosynthesis UDP-glucose lipid carrier transferase
MRQWLASHDVDQIYFSYLSSTDLSMQQVLRFLGDTCKPVYYLPAWAMPSMQFDVDQLGDAFTINLWGQEGSLIDQRLKRLADLLIAALALVLLSPLLLVIALLVLITTPGPVFFAQTRYGLDGRPFRMLKFRTMSVTEDGATPGLQQARRDDPRVTPIGRILRRWSLDELPQLFNVLGGSMSLVGPRPHAVDHNEHYRKLIPAYMQRHLFRPGMTGLAQVEGLRGETAELDAMARRVEADLRYQREWSLSLDLRILLRTVLHLRSRNAY